MTHAMVQTSALGHKNASVSWGMVFAILAVVAVAMFAPALASADPGQILCTLASATRGNLGRAVATIAVVTVGMAACFGRASWSQAVVVGIGISVMANPGYFTNLFGLGVC